MATKKDAPEEPIVAIYPVPGEVDEREKDRLPPVPTRIERERAKKAVDTGAFSYEDPSQTEEAIAARAPAVDASKSEIAKAVKAAETAATKAAEDAAATTITAKDAEIEALKAQLAEATKK